MVAMSIRVWLTHSLTHSLTPKAVSHTGLPHRAAKTQNNEKQHNARQQYKWTALTAHSLVRLHSTISNWGRHETAMWRCEDRQTDRQPATTQLCYLLSDALLTTTFHFAARYYIARHCMHKCTQLEWRSLRFLNRSALRLLRHTASNLLNLSGPSLAAHKANIQARPEIWSHPKGACALDTVQFEGKFGFTFFFRCGQRGISGITGTDVQTCVA